MQLLISTALGAVLTMTITVAWGGEVRLTQETPCVTGQGCRLKCSLVAGNLDWGFQYTSGSDDIAQCIVGGVCSSAYPSDYTASLEDSRTSYLDIRSFRQLNVGTWSCSDGPSGRASSIPVVQNVLPSGVLTFGSTCQSGRVTSPASLSCSGLSPGVPPASLLLKDSSGQTVGSSQTGSVTGTVTRGGQASCSVSWSALPSYILNISPVQCDVQTPPHVTRVTNSPVTVREGQSVNLTCEATGSPAPRFSWSRRETPVTSGSRSSLTFTPDRNTQTVTCTASNSGGQDSATFTLDVQYLPPGAPVLSPGGVFNEGHDVNLTCWVTGGNPSVSSITLTCPRHNNTSQGDVTRLQFTADRRDQGSCVCSASHVLGYTQTASVNITVHYAPTVNITSTSQGHVKVITCIAEGQPAQYNFRAWLQMWGEQEVRRVNGSQLGGQYNLTLTSYQDTGNYTCSVGNEVATATATADVVIQDVPQLPRAANPEFQSGEAGEMLELYRTLYSMPELSNVTWFYNSAPLPASTRGSGSLGTAVSMQLPVHGSLVEVQGRRVTLPVTVSANSTGTYRLQACNPVQCSSANLTLLAAGPPFLPANFTATPFPGNIVLAITPGYPGGDYFQWFHVQYRRQDSQEEQWSDVSNVGNRSSSDRTRVTVTVEGLEPDTSYVFRVRAQNSRPKRNLSNYTELTVATLAKQPELAIGPLVGGLLGGFGGLALLIIIVIVFLKKRNGLDKSDKNSSKAALNAVSMDQEPHLSNEKETGESSSGTVHPIFEDIAQPEVSQSPAVYAVVNKKSKKSSVKQNAGMVYAQVKKKGKEKKKSSQHKNGEIYENADMHQVASGAGDPALSRASGGVTPSREVDDSGCVYVTIQGTAPPSLNSPRPPTAPKPARTQQRLQDDAVIYTVIDHTKKAPTLPDEEEK